MNKWKLANGQTSPIVYVNVNNTSEFPTEANNKNNNNFDDDEEIIDIDAMLLEDILYRTEKIRSIQSVQAKTILKQGTRTFALDATPLFVLATGRAVQGMLASGVADYLEFKTVDGLSWLEKTTNTKSKGDNNNNNNNNNNKSNNKTYHGGSNMNENENNGIDGDDIVLSHVLCNKNDVFGTKLLAPMEKQTFHGLCDKNDCNGG